MRGKRKELNALDKEEENRLYHMIDDLDDQRSDLYDLEDQDPSDQGVQTRLDSVNEEISALEDKINLLYEYEEVR